MRKRIIVVVLLLIVLLLSACDSSSNYKVRQYEGLKGEVTGEMTYKCPRCGTYTLVVASGKSYGICTKCDEKYYIK